MGWTVILESQSRKEISIVDAEWEFDDSLAKSSKLIKYLDPYGDTIFNGLQMDDLITDLEKLQELNYSETTTKVIELAVECKTNSHIYLVFYGD
jgi:hypothetical protein